MRPRPAPFYDADSHIMELPDFLKDYADPDLRDEIPEVSYTASIVTDEEVAVIVGAGRPAQRRRTSPPRSRSATS